MEIVLFLKPIVDMLYQFQWLDVALILLCIFFYVRSANLFQLCKFDAVILVMAVLFGFSFLRNTAGVADWIKIETGFFSYFLGRRLYDRYKQYASYLVPGFFVVVLVTLVSYLTGAGFQMWGIVNTFTGLYFFKTDLAAAMAQAIIFFSIFAVEVTDRKKRLLFYGLILLCVFFIVVSNARIYYFITIVLLAFIYGYRRELIGGERIKPNMKHFLVLVFLSLLVLLLMNSLQDAGMGDEYLLVQFDEPEDLMDEKNTQGRSVVWALILDYFFSQDFLSQLFGVDLVTDGIIGVICESHNLYIKVLFATGYVGFLFFACFVIMSIRLTRNIQEIELYYVTLGLLTIYLVSGVSYSTIVSTQLTWLPMFYLGISVTCQDLSVMELEERNE